MRHRSNDLDAVGGYREIDDFPGLIWVTGAQAAHAAVELDVYAPASRAHHSIQAGRAPDHHLGLRFQRFGQLDLTQRAHHKHRHPMQAHGAQLNGLASTRNGKPSCAAGERRARTLRRAVTVAVGLYDRTQLTALLKL